ncbi:hypothetical protein, partial [Streptococcus pluranimalium]
MDTRNIKRAYYFWYRHALGTNSANLSLESNKRATAYFQFQASLPWLNGPSWNGALRVQVDAYHLVTCVMSHLLYGKKRFIFFFFFFFFFVFNDNYSFFFTPLPLPPLCSVFFSVGPPTVEK